MRKMISALIAVGISCMSLTGCSPSTPMGSDSEVKKLVIEIAQDELRAQLTTAMYAQISRIPVNEVSYAKLKAKAQSDKTAGETIEKVDEIMSKIKMSLENIRTDKVEKELKKSSSSAELRIDDKKVPIEYTAQINADGQLYVEVAGLRF
ncbi:MAG: hypothetical protein PHV82_06455 [Victivallaceae bacterium]|nr:hypothetical protein [Victivallaceae bacterium]